MTELLPIKALRLSKYAVLNGTVPVQDIEVDQRFAKMHVIDMFKSSYFINSPYRSYTLRELVSASHAAAALVGPAAAGGALPKSLGLVMDHGKVTSPPDYGAAYATGVFCIGKDGWPTIFNVSQLRNHSCVEAVQSGPLVVETYGKTAIPGRFGVNYEHLLLAIDRAQHVHILVVSRVNLYDAGLDFSKRFASVLNIAAGPRQSAVWINSPPTKYLFGNVDGEVPSAMLITP